MKRVILLLWVLMVHICVARQVSVSSYPEIRDACQNALPGDTIIIAKGIYTIDGNNRIMVTNRPGPVLVIGESGDPRDVTIKGLGMDTDAVEMIFNLDNSPRWKFEAITARDAYYHAFKFDDSSTDCVLHNVIMLDNGESGVKGTSNNITHLFPDRLLVEHCVIGYSKQIGSLHPEVEGIDGVGVNDWIIRNNLFRNIQKGAFDHAAYAVFTKGNSDRTIIDRNRFEDCFIGASFGGGGTDPQFFRGGDQTYEHRNGIIKNNVIIRCSDAGIYINKGSNCKIFNNTLIQCELTIQLRYPESTGEVKNNLVLLAADNPNEPIIRLRDGAGLLADLANRQAGAQEFVDIIGSSDMVDADLRELSPSIDAGVTVPEVPDDFKGTLRPQGNGYDIGAYEYASTGVAANKISNAALSVAYENNLVDPYLVVGSSSHITITLFDMLGREKGTLANGIFEEGRYRLELPSWISPGAYFAILDSDGRRSLSKIAFTGR
ncbi:MAG: right-handed parallel beta-helix repeat-containing protein [Bacteroidota bacterium]|nr:right-handed parallel beta-helix repeat-containing protein [Bacteroidota bacterium]MDP4229254.1 right-handed parallel beta-helix repeat-containing protein [Bacteroidota bacterium]MDP4236233.1 right-handed parallel beta-helix repeat-containing protein [Bacteroidota bacterium]